MHRGYRGVHGAAKGWLIATLQQEFRRLLVITRDRQASEEILTDLEFFTRSSDTTEFTSWETLPYEDVSPQIEVSAARLHTLYYAHQKQTSIIVAPAEAVMQRVLPAGVVESLCIRLTTGEAISRTDLIIKLELAGFHRVPLVATLGEYAVRGGVIDIFPYSTSMPVRIEFIDQTIESMRFFNPDSQRSLGVIPTIEMTPVRESLLYTEHSALHSSLELAKQRLRSRAQELGTPPSELTLILEAFEQGAHIPGIELAQAIALDSLTSCFSYLPPDTVIVVDDHMGIGQSFDAHWEVLEERENARSADHFLVPRKEALALAPDEVWLEIGRFPLIHLNRLDLIDPENTAETAKPITIRTESHIALATKLKTKVGTGEALEPLESFITKHRKARFRIAFVVGSPVRAERLQRLLLDYNLDAPILECTGMEWIEQAERYPLSILSGHLSQGIKLVDEQLIFLSEAEVFGERSYRRRGKTGTAALTKRLLNSLGQLSEGDYVVHSDYGVGVYRGIKHLEVETSISDFLQIDYLDSRLYLPVQNISKIQKFSAAEGQKPTLDKLASHRWRTTKQKVRQSVISLAGELIKLYAARSVAKGWRYEPYGAEDDRFADGFAFDETPDQLKAIQETINDMSLDKPMDRLICGDVGFGKTEVALRAAYKCTQHARQVAVLVPTTILVEQHKNNFLARFAEYGVEIGAVSRFYSAKHNAETIQKLADGKIDIIIGTHRLLSRDVTFQDLGLVIIDEEHRFGVKQKERLKQLKKQVDVLTLTATPIPRTLYMSLLSIRDVSTIMTAPHTRRAPRTYVASHSDALVRDALLRELGRGGQSFYLHNRVKSIDIVTSHLSELVPEARFAFAHGQMSERQLEDIMRSFLNREIDVLVSTTIIESGLDIPNANTMIVERADTFGLAQLYQIRGRVGRSKRQAYAYLMIPKKASISAEAEQRLSVLQSLDDLGGGFNLALRDLEIRGAGNLLGKEQSGNVAAVGFDLYTKILRDAVLHLKGEDVSLEEELDPEVNIRMDAYIPESYIPDISERLIMYQRLASLASPEDAWDLTQEMEDRFGRFDSHVQNFIELMQLKWRLKVYGVVKAEYLQQKLLLTLSPRARIDGAKLAKLLADQKDTIRLSKNLVLTISCQDAHFESPAEIERVVVKILDSLVAEALPAAVASHTA